MLHRHRVRYLRAGHLTLGIVAVAAGLAILPFAFELLALHHLTPTAFGTPMAIEPAIGVLLGILVLHQTPTAVQIIGSVLVVTRRHRRATRRTTTPAPTARTHRELIG